MPGHECPVPQVTAAEESATIGDRTTQCYLFTKRCDLCGGRFDLQRSERNITVRHYPIDSLHVVWSMSVQTTDHVQRLLGVGVVGVGGVLSDEMSD